MGENTRDACTDWGQRCRWEKYFPLLSVNAYIEIHTIIKLGANDFTQQDFRVVCIFKVK